MYVFIFVFLYLILNTKYIIPAHAATNPLSVSNNKFGIHIININSNEASTAASLVNSNGGDWGYVTVIIQSNDRDHNKWQQFFDTLREKHLIPIVRMATQAQGDSWELPYDKEEDAWADFLNDLNWPTKNRYVVVYNEPNHAQEWGNTIDAANYAKVLDKTVKALKAKSDDFFVLNAGLDASAPEKLPTYEDEKEFLTEMNTAVPGIFNELDGWNSHSYPNPGFAGSPNDSGRGTIRNYQWELSTIQSLGLTKDLPVFITETGWEHAEGMDYNSNLPSAAEVAAYYKDAFSGAWNDSKIVAVTPFLLNYQQAPFDHFSFEKSNPGSQPKQVLGVAYNQTQPDPSPFYPQFNTIESLNKQQGTPIQENQGILESGSIYSSLVANQQYDIPFTFKNTGQSIWGEAGLLKLVVLEGTEEFQIQPDSANSSTRIEPGQEITFHIRLTAPDNSAYSLSSPSYKIGLALYNGANQVSTQNMEYTTQVKSPVILIVKATLDWKKNFSGNYILSIISSVGQSARAIVLGDGGVSQEIKATDLLPDYSFDFTLQKPFYQSKTIHQIVHSGVNTLDFGQLEPDFGPATLVHPKAMWSLLPFSN